MAYILLFLLLFQLLWMQLFLAAVVAELDSFRANICQCIQQVITIWGANVNVKIVRFASIYITRYSSCDDIYLTLVCYINLLSNMDSIQIDYSIFIIREVYPYFIDYISAIFFRIVY